MSGRIFMRANFFISVVAILGDWTVVGMGVARQHHNLNRQDGSQSISDPETVNIAADEHARVPEVPKKELLLDSTYLHMGIGKRQISSSIAGEPQSISDQETVNIAADQHAKGPSVPKKPVLLEPTDFHLGIGKRQISSSIAGGPQSISDPETVNIAADQHARAPKVPPKEIPLDPTYMLMGIGKR